MISVSGSVMPRIRAVKLVTSLDNRTTSVYPVYVILKYINMPWMVYRLQQKMYINLDLSSQYGKFLLIAIKSTRLRLGLRRILTRPKLT